MKVRLFIGANSYAMIEQESGARTDILLTDPKAPAESLREYARKERARAERIAALVDLAEKAAAILDAEKAGAAK